MIAGPAGGGPGRPRVLRPPRAFALFAITAAVVALGVSVYQQGRTAGRDAAERDARTAAETAYLTVLRRAPVEHGLLPQGLTGLTDIQLLDFGPQAWAAYRAGGRRPAGSIPGRPGLIASPPNPMLPLVFDTASRELCPQYLAGSDPGPPGQRWDPSP